MKYLLGYDIGSSSVKASLLEASTGKLAAGAFSPATEMRIQSDRPGFAEQDPDLWWEELLNATRLLRQQVGFKPEEIISIGISYQMHGLVCIDRDGKPLRPAIIWCDSRAVEIGHKAFHDLGEQFCLQHFGNSPGNFTASKLKWVKDNEPDLYQKIYRALLPGDYIAMKLTGQAVTTVSGLSEGICWDFQAGGLAQNLLDYYGIDAGILAPLVPTFGDQGRLGREAADLLGIAVGTSVSYRAGDQPNNAYSLRALEAGEVAATAGTSGVVYGVTDKAVYDPLSRVNPFVHVNHRPEAPRIGVLLCVNGTGILNSWLKNNLLRQYSYEQINQLAAQAPPGSDGLQFFPFGNGAERILSNRDPGATLRGLQFNRHDLSHLARAAQEGIVFALCYGMEIMEQMGMTLSTIRAGFANMFLSEVFASTFANISGCRLELYNTDGATGAARAAGVGAGFYPDFTTSFKGMEIVRKYESGGTGSQQAKDAYQQWKIQLSSINQ